MTIWQKRLILFFIKFFGVIIIIFIIALFLYYHLYFKKDNLIKYVPKEAVFYSAFRLNEETFKQPLLNKIINQLKQDYNLPDFDLNNLNHFVSYNSALAIIPKSETPDLQFDYLLVFNLKPHIIDLEPKLNLFNQTDLKYELLTNSALEKNILIVSNSQGIIEQVKQINRQEAPSLVGQLNVLINLKKFKLDYLAKSYLNIDWFNDNLSKINDLPLKLLIVSAKADNLDNLYLGLKSVNNKLVLETSALKIIDDQSRLLEKVPNNYLASFSFSNAAAKINQLVDLLQAIDPITWQQVQTNKDYFANIYSFEWQELLDLFANQAQIVVNQDNNWILGLNLAQIQDKEAKIARLEQGIKEYLAYNNPVIREKMLPDYTYIKQIIKNTEDLEFQSEEVANISLKSIKQDNFEFAYYINDNYLFLANSSQIIKDYLENKDLIQINQVCNVNKANFRQNLLIKTDYLSQYYPYFKYFNNLLVNEALSDNQQIWLCLE